jgi:cytochrome c oxidase cbb3-type subunit 3
MKRALLLLLFFCACTKTPPETKPAPVVDAAPPKVDARSIAEGACFSCHSEEMLAQQRLPKEKWAAEVKKMAGWGANLDPLETETLVTWLAETYGPDAGPWEPKTITPQEALDELALEDDGPYAAGDPDRGKTLYVDRCSGCHGGDARGHIGVSLVERPFLYRAPKVAEVIRKGRGKMLPIKATDAEIGDILSYLRRQRVKP